VPYCDIVVGWPQLAAKHPHSLLLTPLKYEREKIVKKGVKKLMGFTITGKTDSTLGI